MKSFGAFTRMLVLAPLAALGFLVARNLLFPEPEGEKNGQERPGETYLRQSPGASGGPQRPATGLGVVDLKEYPAVLPGDRTPLDLWRYAGRGASSWAPSTLHMPFGDWLAKHREQKPKLMAAVRAHMSARYSFDGKAMEGVTMSGGKPAMKGPVARLH